MTTNKEVRDQLMSIHTNFHDDEEEPTFVNEITMDNFGSFLTYKKALPSNDVIRNDFKEELLSDEKSTDFLPNTIFEKYGYDFTFNDNFFKDEKDGGQGDNEFNNNCMFVAMNVAARPGEFSIKGWKNFHDQAGRPKDQNMLKMNLEINDSKFAGSYATDAIKKVVDSNSSNVENDFFTAKAEKKFSFSNNSSDMDDDKRAEEYLRLDIKAEEAAQRSAGKKNTTSKYVRRFPDITTAKNEVIKNHVIFYKSANLFVEEWKTVQPKHIVAFGGTTIGLLENMKDTEAFQKYPDLCRMIEEAIQIHHYSYRLNLKGFYNEYSDELNEMLREKNSN